MKSGWGSWSCLYEKAGTYIATGVPVALRVHGCSDVFMIIDSQRVAPA